MKKYNYIRLKILNNNIPRSAQRPVEVLRNRLLLQGCCLIILFIIMSTRVNGQYCYGVAGQYCDGVELWGYMGAQSSSY